LNYQYTGVVPLVEYKRSDMKYVFIISVEDQNAGEAIRHEVARNTRAVASLGNAAGLDMPLQEAAVEHAWGSLLFFNTSTSAYPHQRKPSDHYRQRYIGCNWYNDRQGNN
jgi:hypothetical protein